MLENKIWLNRLKRKSIMLDRHNFEKSWCTVTRIGNLLPANKKFGCKTKTDKSQRKTHMPSYRGVVWLWWKWLLCTRLKSLTLLFRLCPISLLRKSFPLCCILFYVVLTCGLVWEFILSDALDKDWYKIISIKIQFK